MEEKTGYSAESRAILIIVMLLTGMGLIVVYSASVYNGPAYAFKQLIWVLLGYAAFFVVGAIASFGFVEIVGKVGVQLADSRSPRYTVCLS